jgi:hypothetical protein
MFAILKNLFPIMKGRFYAESMMMQIKIRLKPQIRKIIKIRKNSRTGFRSPKRSQPFCFPASRLAVLEDLHQAGSNISEII